jgi:hypothetical protein
VLREFDPTSPTWPSPFSFLEQWMVIDTYRAAILFSVCTELLAALAVAIAPPMNPRATVKLPPARDTAGLTVYLRARS